MYETEKKRIEKAMTKNVVKSDAGEVMMDKPHLFLFSSLTHKQMCVTATAAHCAKVR